MKILFVTNIPSPYRVDFFNELGKYCGLDVVFERAASAERDESWKKYQFINFRGEILRGIPLGIDKAISLDIIRVLRRNYDYVVICNAVTPVGMLAIAYLKLMKKDYFIEGDGAQYVRQNEWKEKLKYAILAGASGYFSTSKELDIYYIAYGAKESSIYRYPFSSVTASDIQEASTLMTKKENARKELGIPKEKKVVLTIGRFHPIKGFDLLIKCAGQIRNNVDFYIVGGEPIEEYIELKKEHNADNVIFCPFMQKKELQKYFSAADIFVLPTRYDPWGLVINEAMAYGLPIVSTTGCVAALELIEEFENGFVVPKDDTSGLREKIELLLANPELIQKIQKNNLDKIGKYTIEAMAKRHVEVLSECLKNT